jgi:hypothetical protein
MGLRDDARLQPNSRQRRGRDQFHCPGYCQCFGSVVAAVTFFGSKASQSI